MAETECWIVAELADSGDPEAVIDAVLENAWEMTRGQPQGDGVVLYGRQSSFGEVKGPLRSVSDHLERLVFVAAVEGGEGATRSRYYEDADELDEPTEKLPENAFGRWWVGDHFDYYTTRYDIDAAV